MPPIDRLPHHGHPDYPLATTLRDAEAIRLRQEGHSYKQIADTLGISLNVARNAVQRHIERVTEELKESVEEVRTQEVARLDQWMLTINRLVERVVTNEAIDDERKLHAVNTSVNTALRVQERRAKYLGLDAPTVVRHEEETFEDIIARIEARRPVIDVEARPVTPPEAPTE